MQTHTLTLCESHIPKNPHKTQLHARKHFVIRGKVYNSSSQSESIRSIHNFEQFSLIFAGNWCHKTINVCIGH